MFLSKYGVARHIYIPMVKRGVVDHAVSADWTPAAGDVKISKNGGAAANVTNLPSAIAMGNSTVWDFSITATEMQAAQITVTIGDSATKAVEDSGFIIETYGNASAQHAVDLSDGVRAGLTALPNAAASAVGGLPVAVDTSGRVDVLKINGTSQTARDLGASVLLSAGTGTGQLDFTSGVVKANLAQILGTALTETAGQIAAGFKKFFDVAAPVFTAASVNQTGNAFVRLGAPAGASVSADIAAAKVDTAAIKAKTDNLPADPADASDIAAAFGTVNGTLATIASYVDTEVGTLQVTLDAVKDKTDLIPGSGIPSADDNAQALLDAADGVETGLTLRQTQRLMSAVLLGKASGMGSTTAVFRDVNDSKNRVIASVDSDGDRMVVSLDPA